MTTKEIKIRPHGWWWTFEDSKGYGDGFLALDDDLSKKSFFLAEIPEDWKKIVLVNLEEITAIK